MNWFLLQKVGFWLFVLLTLHFVFKRRMLSLMKLYFWGMTFTTCYQYAFTIWFPTKVIVLGMLACMFFYGVEKRKSSVPKMVLPLTIFFIIMLFLGDIMAFLSPGQYAQNINKFSRIINTNYTYVTSFALLFFGSLMSRGYVKEVYPSYCIAMEVAIGFGILHYICLKTGIEFMPILRQNGTVNLEAMAEIGGKAVPRIYGVSGEPKNLGFLACPYVLVQIIMYGQGYYRYNNPLYHIGLILMGIFVLVNTYSSAVIINFSIAVIVIMLFLPMGNLIKKLFPLLLISGIIFCINFLKNDNNSQSDSTGNFFAALYERSFGRAQNEMSEDRQERVILDYYFSDPDVMPKLIGYGPGQYTFHVPGQTINDSLIPVQSGLVLTLVDFGLIGIIVLLWIFLMIFQVLKKAYYAHSLFGIAFSVAALSSFVGSLMFGSLVSSFIYLTLALYAFYDDLEIKRLANK